MKYFVTKISENIHKTPEGYLLCMAVPIGGLGELIYARGEVPDEIGVGKDGRIVIQREAEELFRPETIASFEGKPFTIRHPEEFVDPSNWKELAVGILQNVRREGNDLISDILVTDQIAIGLINEGLREVSCGYEAEYIRLEEGKGKQTNIIGNHLALVEEGRAGPAYAINDHKKGGKEAPTMKKKFGDKLKELFAKTADEAVKALDEAEASEKAEKSADADADPDKKDDKEKAKDEGAACYDELVQMVKDLGEKISAMAPKKDAGDEEKPMEEKKDEPAKDEMGSVEDRLKALEMAFSKMLEAKSGDEDPDMAEDDDMEEETTMVGDTAARAEILSPGIELTKDVKVKALKAAYGTKDGKSAIEKLTGGKAPAFDNVSTVDTLFIAASELLKVSRSGEFSKTKQTRDSDFGGSVKPHMTPERMNEINAAKYKLSN